MILSIIGLGNIGSALFNGLSMTETLFVFDKKRSAIERLQPGSKDGHSIETILIQSDVIFLCVRTGQVEDFLRQHSTLLSKKTIVFFQAGFSLRDISMFNLEEAVLIRAITNINVASKNGYTVLLENVFSKEYMAVYTLLKSLGNVREVQTENELESLAVVPGCSPAIVALLVHYLEGIAQGYGADKNSNKEAIFEAISGTIANMRQSGNSSLEMARSVASPGGNVEKALAKVVDSQSIEQALHNFFDEITKY